jgi:hypothetical protein
MTRAVIPLPCSRLGWEEKPNRTTLPFLFACFGCFACGLIRKAFPLFFLGPPRHHITFSTFSHAVWYDHLDTTIYTLFFSFPGTFFLQGDWLMLIAAHAAGTTREKRGRQMMDT